MFVTKTSRWQHIHLLNIDLFRSKNHIYTASSPTPFILLISTCPRLVQKNVSTTWAKFRASGINPISTGSISAVTCSFCCTFGRGKLLASSRRKKFTCSTLILIPVPGRQHEIPHVVTSWQQVEVVSKTKLCSSAFLFFHHEIPFFKLHQHTSVDRNEEFTVYMQKLLMI